MSFLKHFRVDSSRKGPGVKKIFQKPLILVFEVIAQTATTQKKFEIGTFFRILAHCGIIIIYISNPLD